MASWSDLLPPLLVAAALLYVPGGLVAVAARLPVRAAVALAPALSVAIIAGTGVLAPMMGRAWGLTPTAEVTVAVTLAVAAGRLVKVRPGRTAAPDDAPADEAEAQPDAPAQDEPTAEQSSPSRPASPARWSPRALLRRRAGRPPSGRRPLGGLRPADGRRLLEDLGLWAVSAVLVAVTCARFINTPDAFSQTYDAVYHLNAVRWILDTANASSLSFTMVVSDGAIYPLGWHTLVVLTMRLSGTTSIPLATNAVMFAVAGFVWTSGTIALTGAVTAGRRAGRIASAVLASAAPAFPLLVLFWGILYPTFLAAALLPGVLLTAVVATGPGTLRRRAVLWIMVLGGCAGVALAQPSIVVIAIIAAVAASAVHAVSAVSLAIAARTRHEVLRAALACGLAVLLAAASWSIAPALRASKSVSTWPRHITAAGGIGEAVMSAPERTTIVWPLAILVIIGFLSAWHRPRARWLAATHAVVCALYVVTVSRSFDPLRYNLTGFWYSDAYRLGGFMMITALPLAGVGACGLTDAVARALPGAAHAIGKRRWSRATLAILVIAALAWQGPGSAAMSHDLRRFERTFLVTSDSQVLTTDELAVIRRLPDLAGPDDVILVDPWKGGSLAYALTDLTVLPRHLTSYSATSPALEFLENNLDEVAVNPEVCPAIKELGVDYVLDFKGRVILDGWGAAGMDNIRPRDGFDLVLRIGDASVYHVSACA